MAVLTRDRCVQMSAGGLVSALTGVQHFDTLWVGWPGGPLHRTQLRRVQTPLLWPLDELWQRLALHRQMSVLWVCCWHSAQEQLAA